MKALSLLLKVMAPVFFLVALLHIVLGLGADALLGATVSQSVQAEPSLSSQNRFYGAAFGLYGAVLYLCSKNLHAYAPFFKAAMWLFFAAGASRLVSWVQYGPPAPLVVALLVVELALPAALLAWHARAKNEG